MSEDTPTESNSASHFRLSFMASLLVIGPLWLTGWLLLKLFLFDGAIKILPMAWQPETLIGRDIPGLGIVPCCLFIFAE